MLYVRLVETVIGNNLLVNMCILVKNSPDSYDVSNSIHLYEGNVNKSLWFYIQKYFMHLWIDVKEIKTTVIIAF